MGLTRPRAQQIFDIDYKQATRVITITNIVLSGGAPAVVDGVSLVAKDRVLVTGQTTASQNGLYLVSVVGVGSDGTWVRTGDGNETGEIEAGMIIMVTEGITYHDTQWLLTTNNPIIIGTTTLVFAPNTGSGSSYSDANVATYLSSGNVITAIKTTSTISATGNMTGGNISATGNITGSYIIGNGSLLTNITGANITGIVANATYAFTANAATYANHANVADSANAVSGANVTGTVGLAQYVTQAAQANITSVGTLTSLSVTGNVTAGNISVGTRTITGGNIVNSNSNGVGNIGSSSTYFNTVFAKSTSAQYADLAEMYVADAEYPPGTVLEFGGSHEVTISNTPFSPLVIGVVSTNPAYLMNSNAQGKYTAAIALVGRVPTQVIGPVSKGAMMVSAGNGYAQASTAPAMGTVIGKAVESFAGESGVIEITIGRL